MTTDFLVIGAGVAGLRAAITLAGVGQVLVLAKDTLHESASEYAQGGIAAALSDDDQVALHEQDTMQAGDGLCDAEAVRTLVAEGPRVIEELLGWGAEFDREDGELVFGREGAHSRNRILHAHGDSTGREISRTLYRRAASLANVRFLSFAAVTDLLLHNGEVRGAMAFDARHQQQIPIYARAVLLATGGLGRVYKETTNPDVATGDGVAMGYRAGAVVENIEFVQFHPTALHLDGAPRFLLSEALRGEGAYLRNAAGERFQDELASRDIVSRAIVREMGRTGAPHMFLDMTHFPPGAMEAHFPRIFETCLHYGLDLRQQPAPVHPAAHYAMGGVQTDLAGQTTVPRLFAAGEVACTGVHGANRLASNSLLEGVVFGARAAEAMQGLAAVKAEGETPRPELFPAISEAHLRAIAWEYCGITRDGAGLRKALELFRSVPLEAKRQAQRVDYELRSLHQVALLIAEAALTRRESRGGHYRSDFPDKSAPENSRLRRGTLE
ncbi:MAG: L-aspartate oxidase [Acidobacteria bacterium]|nr:L-aspartate oxidase [Bryobacteraceae bacterium CoA2 C42]MCA2965061.1 L-aspartate oxidase [Acidobacteriaceae bacterium]